MSKFILILCSSLFITAGLAQTPADALKAREQAMHALNGFSPASVLNGYTQNPKETSHLPQEGTNTLPSAGLNALSHNPEALEVYQHAGTRTKGRYNPNSPEMRYAEQLLENPESAVDGVCYKEPGFCESTQESKTCEETVGYKNISCGEALKVTLKPLTQNFTREVMFPQGSATFHLAQCGKHNKKCSKANLAEISPACEALNLVVMYHNKVLQIIKNPTCKDPTVTVSLGKIIKAPIPLRMTLTQQVSEESWVTQACDKNTSDTCVLTNTNSCLEPNATKIMEGIAITRPCWGHASNYQCSYLENSYCMPLLQAGCSQVSSRCLNASNGLCTRFLQTFSCMNQVCFPEKTICPDKIPCSDGSCDLSFEEESDDAAEGLSRLGALAGVASDVATKQVRSGVPAIFTGTNSTCRKVVANTRNCCHGSYQMTHCSDDEKRLAKAKEEGRAYKVGTFCALKKLGLCLEEKESWCVFPTKLASILQIQGRFYQLGIHFGWAKDEDNKANCRGITPEELERINFSALDLSPITQELMNRKVLPNDGQVSAVNQSHIERLKQMGRAHD
ncbi:MULTISPECIES: conjugal transfer protein TraN [Legionellaceae]|uniref:Conjugative transfer protein TraN n=1 Tax=Legionella bozemanae TaxID=447 RepID=A0A0W0R9N5_LEGBO|nr:MULTISPECIES: conjugal transfer protein TraN [Legionellaceae]KTC67708.1 conjugative transfer protein TraN [Legionella bozemanae]MCW8497073.1 conjugal transfer protein TraN [Fluoribacter dumoffii]STO32897.1 conjugal transfer mating pair stabilization protein TraN [Legionella bozemanae]